MKSKDGKYYTPQLKADALNGIKKEQFINNKVKLTPITQDD